MSRAFGRRHFLGVLTAVSGGRAYASGLAPDDRFEILDWKLPGARDLSRRTLVIVPRGLAAGERVPVLVLLHGLGETSNETAGVRAWIDRYGLLTAHARLSRPPVASESARGDLPAARAGEINDALRSRPFGGRFVFVCPFTPNVWRLPDTSAALDRLADWVVDVLLPEVRAKAPADTSPARTAIDGCSLGGFVGLELFLRRPQAFGAWGGVQSALRVASAGRWAERVSDALRVAGPRGLHLETSLGDPFHDANVALARELDRRSVPHDLRVLPGPHDQPWLRDAGTLEMLLWHDRALSGG